MQGLFLHDEAQHQAYDDVQNRMAEAEQDSESDDTDSDEGEADDDVENKSKDHAAKKVQKRFEHKLAKVISKVFAQQEASRG